MSYALIAVVGVIVLIVLWAIGTYNGLISAKNKVAEAFSTMDVYLKKRYDLIPNVVETVKGYAKHESETLEAVINARSRAVSSTSVEDKVNAEKELSGALGRLLAISEAYPDLKANTNFMDLQNQLKSMEGEIASSRKFYNAVTMNYNIKIQSVPSNIIAGIFNFTEKPLFETPSEERENVKVAF
jgi:LemA protein